MNQPKYHDWKRSENDLSIVTSVDRSNGRITFFPRRKELRAQLCNDNGQFARTNSSDEVIVLKFVCNHKESCMLINDKLHMNLTMKEVLKVGDVLEYFNFCIYDEDGTSNFVYTLVEYCKFHVKTNAGGYTLKWKQVRNMTVDTFTNLKYIDNEYTIEIIVK